MFANIRTEREQKVQRDNEIETSLNADREYYAFAAWIRTQLIDHGHVLLICKGSNVYCSKSNPHIYTHISVFDRIAKDLDENGVSIQYGYPNRDTKRQKITLSLE